MSIETGGGGTPVAGRHALDKAIRVSDFKYILISASLTLFF